MPTDMLIKQMPDEFKAWIADEAQRHHRSMNKEAVALPEVVRAQRWGRPRADQPNIDTLLTRFRALPDLNRRMADEILGYDDAGLPA